MKSVPNTGYIIFLLKKEKKIVKAKTIIWLSIQPWNLGIFKRVQWIPCNYMQNSVFTFSWEKNHNFYQFIQPGILIPKEG